MGGAVGSAIEVNSSEPLDILCENDCLWDGETHSCRERVQWLVRERGSTIAAALDLVSHECDGQCMCSPTDFPEWNCESPCMFEGETHSCRERAQWLVRERGSTVAAALDTVSQECGGQCMCSAADLEPQVTSQEPPQNELTTTSTSVTMETVCNFRVVFCGYTSASPGEDNETLPPPENWELTVGECSPDGRGGAYQVNKPPSSNPYDPDCGIASPYYVHVDHFPEESCTIEKDNSSFMVFTDGYCGNCCDINTGLCNSRCAGFLSPVYV